MSDPITEPGSWRRIEPILDRLLDAPPEERSAILEETCGEDAELRARIETVLAADADASGLLAEATAPRLGELLREVGWSPAEEDDLTGRTVGDHCIVRRIRGGGMGVVYEARTPGGERVALKVLSRQLVPSAHAAERFTREIWIAGQLDHPNLVKVHERGTRDGVSFYTMELIEGGSLEEVVSRMRADGRDERLGLEFGSTACVEWIVERVVEVARALAHVHRHGVVHRDIKPGNLLLDASGGTIKIVDFGLAIDPAAVGGAAGRLTTTGRVLGTPIYMAPEQIQAKREETDGRTDIYALGVTLYELLTLELPYGGETAELSANAAIAKDATLRTALDSVIRRSLHPDRKRRHPTADAFADDLSRTLHPHSRRSDWSSRLRAWLGRGG